MSRCAYAHRPIVIDRTCIEFGRHYERDTSSHRHACFLVKPKVPISAKFGAPLIRPAFLIIPSGADHVLSSYAAQRYPTSSRVALGSRSGRAVELLAISKWVLESWAIEAAKRSLHLPGLRSGRVRAARSTYLRSRAGCSRAALPRALSKNVGRVKLRTVAS